VPARIFPVCNEMKLLQIILLIFFLLAGCENRRSDFHVLKLALDENPTTLDPALIIDVSGGSLAAKLFNGLVRVDKKMRVIGDLADSWTISPDGTVYTFNLRRDVRFHNGRVLTAGDVRYSFERVLHPETGSSRTWIFEKVKGAKEYSEGKAARVEGVTVVDDATVRITLKEPFGPFLWVLTMPNAYVVPAEAVEKWGQDFSQHVVGTGPFKLREWRQDYRIVLAENGDYFADKPKVKEIEYRIIPDQFSAFAEYENGNLDIVSIPRSEYRRLMSDRVQAPHIYSQAGLNVYYLGFNCRKKPFDDPRVRRAFNYAIDRDTIVKTILEERSVPARSVLPPGLSGNEKPESGYPYDPDMARKLLREAGIPDGFAISLYQNRTKEASHIAEGIQHYLQRAGIRVHIVEREWSSYKEALIKGEADMFFLSWWADYPDAENFFYPNFYSANVGAAGNKTFFKNSAVDALIEEAQQVSDEARRTACYRKLNEEIFEAAPWVFLWHKKEFVVVQPWVKGYYLYPIYNADKGTDVSIETVR